MESFLSHEVVAVDLAPGVSVIVEVSCGRITDAWMGCPEAASCADRRVALAEELSATDKEEVARIARKEVSGKKADERILRAVRNAMTSLFQALYSRRSVWRNEISVDSQS